MEQVYDYIIIGSGSAGSAMAYRLGEDGTRRILVLEFGGSDAGPLIQMPAALSYPMNMKRYDWGYLAEPEPALGGRRLVCPCLLYTSPSPRDATLSRMPSSA